jgi:DNA (cytosine-5)-methyltransferase 1
LDGERSGLFFEIMRLAKEIKPEFIFLENVSAITGRGGLRVVREITSLGYDCRWCIISASSVGALHKRERWFLLAHSKSKGLERQRRISFGTTPTQSKPSLSGENDCNAYSQSSRKTDTRSKSFNNKQDSWREHSGFYWPFESRDDWQKIVSEMDKCFDGIPYHVDRLKALGNAVVPQQVRKAFEELIGKKYEMA